MAPDEVGIQARQIIELDTITRSFGPPPVQALRGVSLTISTNEMVAIVGPSGAGKSTLLNILGMLDEPTSGSMRLDGLDTASLTDRARTALRSNRIGFVFQSSRLVPYLDCVQNVMLPLIHQGTPRRGRYDLATEALKSVGLSHRLWARPATLSGGEQQRVAIARALVHRPAILLCDEPTGNLDSVNTAAVLTLLRGMVSPQRAVVVITHETHVRNAADRAIEVVDGRVH